ncbi:MAG: hypothetical protein P8185_02430 [Deltaproteobacteria bacterium]|jgi:hypothetical protein
MRLGERAGTVKQNEGPADSIMCSSFIQNMSCRPRTTVHSKGLTLSKIPEGLKGENFIIDFRDFVPVSLTRYAQHNPGMSVPIFNALLTFGTYHRHLSKYERFMRSGAAHEQSLMKWVLRAPEEVAGLPGVGFIRRQDVCEYRGGARTIKSLHAALFIMARANRAVYIRDKSPLLSLISIKRRLEIVFVGRRR